MQAGRAHGQTNGALLGDRPAAVPCATADAWTTARGPLRLDRPRIVAVLNATPDSFWAASRLTDVDDAVARAAQALEAGADVLEVGGESTRPGAVAVGEAEERERVVPAIREIIRRWPDALVAVDTVKAGVARAAIDVGAAAVNDVSGLQLDPAMGECVAAAGAGLVLMHSRGDVATMASYALARYGDDPVADVIRELGEALARARSAGVADAAVALDPGLGFAKRTEHSAALLRELGRVVALGRPVLVGPSRKRFLGELAGGLDARDRLAPTIAACVLAWSRGARLFRVHDVEPVRRALDVAAAVERIP